MATNYKVTLKEFKFPETLGNNQLDFRLQVDLRFRDGNSFKTKTVILPGLDTYWECAKDENEEGEYKPSRELVRKKDNNDFLFEADPEKMGEWGKMFRVQASEFYEMRVTVFDVDHKGWWDKIAESVSKVFSSLVGFVVPGGNAVIDSVVEESTTSIGRIMVNDDSKVLFVGSIGVENDSGSWKIEGPVKPTEVKQYLEDNFRIVFDAEQE